MRNAWLGWVLVVVGMGCGDDDMTPTECVTSAECGGSETCRDGMCVPAPDVGTDTGADTAPDVATDTNVCSAERTCRGGSACCDEGQECVDGLYCYDVCENTRCGDNGSVCCGEGQTCLDGVVCAADCGDLALCGADLEICCEAGDVCLATECVAPGIECEDDFDCLDDSLYCEPTLSRCLPTPTDVDCELTPEFGEVSPQVEWHWAGASVGARLFNRVITAPVVGDVSGDGVPDVVVQAYAGTDWRGSSILAAISGVDGSTLFTINAGVAAEGTALANFDDDPALEIVYRTRPAGVRIIDGDGVTELGARAFGGAADLGAISVADMNADGTPDVITGCRALNGIDIADPALDFFNLGNCGSLYASFSSSTVADIDSDEELEVVTGDVAIDTDGTILWGSVAGDAAHGLIALGDLDDDGAPEIVKVVAGSLIVKDAESGEVRFGPWAIPGGGVGGAPTVADFDGDGQPEISVAGRGRYTVFDPDCEAPRELGECDGDSVVRWSAPSQDISSSSTGSSVFDFQGDGVAEVVYNDECFLHIFDGRTGAELLTDPIGNSSRTLREYPLVVDVDADGNSEIVVVANNDQIGRDGCIASWTRAFGTLPPELATGTAGVYVYGDPEDRWVGTRRVWNQFGYHVTNVGSSGEIPERERPNWSTAGLNNFRQNVQGRAVANAPNLTATLETVGACASGRVRLSAIIRNEGSRGVAAGIPIEFVRIDLPTEERVADAMTTTALLPGGSERVTVDVEAPGDIDLMFEVRVDGAAEGVGVAEECIEGDNAAQAMARCETIL